MAIWPVNGASNAIYLVCRGYLNKGDHVVIESPVYEPLIATPDFIGCNISYLKRTPPDYRIDLDRLDKLLTPETKMLILTNLHNPSGAHLNNDSLLEIAELAKSRNKNIRILVDEI